MKNKPHIDIYATLKKNAWVTKLSILSSAIVMVVSILMVVNLYRNNDKFVYGISSDKTMLPLERIEANKLQETFMKGHVERFMTKFYQYDQWNYEDQIEASLWLVDQSGKKLYRFYKNNGYINTMIQSTSSQKMTDIKVQLQEQGSFLVQGTIVINKPGKTEGNSYLLTAQGQLKKVSQNYPKNPYGFLITNYKEVSKQKIEQ